MGGRLARSRICCWACAWAIACLERRRFLSRLRRTRGPITKLSKLRIPRGNPRRSTYPNWRTCSQAYSPISWSAFTNKRPVRKVVNLPVARNPPKSATQIRAEGLAGGPFKPAFGLSGECSYAQIWDGHPPPSSAQKTGDRRVVHQFPFVEKLGSIPSSPILLRPENRESWNSFLESLSLEGNEYEHSRLHVGT